MVNRIDAVKLTATKNDDNAKVVITNDDDQTGSPGEAVLDLSVGSNTLTVTVTAQDGTADANLHGHRGTAYRRHLGEQHACE